MQRIQPVSGNRTGIDHAAISQLGQTHARHLWPRPLQQPRRTAAERIQCPDNRHGGALNMCGVAAIFAYHYAAPGVDRDELCKIRDHMTARSPDGKGEWFSTDQRVGLGHRRLSIIDLTDEAAQPMRSADGKRVISFNGEIYNYQALRKSLEAKGRRFRTQSDTEVLLHLYQEKGEAMVHDLRGMFAFVIWDDDRNALLMAHDLYGTKPLYYAEYCLAP